MMLDLLLDDTILRMLLALGIGLLGFLVYRAVNELTLRRARVHARIPQHSKTSSARRAAATLLYFTTPSCAPCKTVQRPAIQRLREQVGDTLEVIEVDAAQQPEIAGEWGVLSVPTTFVLDANGIPRHVNHGVAPLEKLLRQVRDLA